jgi:superkiller protein 3
MGLFTAAVALLSLAMSFQQATTNPAPAAATEQRSEQKDQQLLRNAKRVALIGTTGYIAATGVALNPSAKKAQESLEKEVKKWGRFTVVTDPLQADIVLVLAEGNRAAGGGGTIRTARLTVFPGGPPPKRGEIPLWDEQANGSIFATSGAPKVLSQFRSYLEDLDHRLPALTTNNDPPPAAQVPSTSAPAAPESSTPPPAATLPPTRDVIAPRPAKYVPPLEIISKAKTFSLRGKGTTGDQGKFEKFMGVGKYGDVYSAMAEVYQQLSASDRLQYVEDVSKADIVVLVYQWDTRTYSRQFHGVRTAIQIAEGGAAFEREDPSLWVSGTVQGTTRELVDNLWSDLARFEHPETSQPTHEASKNYNRGCDTLDSAEKNSGHSKTELLFESVAEFRKALRADPNYAPSHERLGTALLLLGYDSAAAYEFKQALRLQPNTHDTLISLAKALGSIPDFKEAEQSVREALHIFPENTKDHLLLADLFFRERDYPAAIVEYSEAVRLQPGDSESRSRLGRAYYRSHQMQKAEAAFRETIRIKPDDTIAMQWLGSTLNEMQRWDEAITVLRTAEKLNAKDASLHFELARALRGLKKYDDALVEIKNALELAPTAATYHLELARLLAESGKIDEAVAKAREIVKNIPSTPAAHDVLGQTLLLKGQPDEAIAEFERAIKLDPKYAAAYFDLGRALDAKGEKTRAMEAYRQARDLEPENERFSAPLKP